MFMMLFITYFLDLFTFQPCTESLYLALFKENRMSLSPVLIEMVQQIQLTSDPNDIMAILRKDAGMFI